MRISSDNFLHFTGRDAVKGMLKGFQIGGSYCREKIIYSDAGDNTIIVPMISLCDVPLETWANLPSRPYGEFGIGLKKDWGFRNKLNPVLYVDQHSTVAEKFKNSDSAVVDLSKDIYEKSLELRSKLQELEKRARNIDSSGESASQLREENEKLKEERENFKNQNTIPKLFLHLIEFIKPYQGEVVIEGVPTKDYRFYDEMEWRFVPDRNTLDPNLPIGDNKQFDDWRGNGAKPIVFALDFEFDDIAEIVVAKNSDIEEFQSFIQDLDDTHLTSEQKDTLCSNVKSAESLKM